MSRRTVYTVISWADQKLHERGRWPRTCEHGSPSTKQAAIRLAARILPPDAEYIIRTTTRTVRQGRTPVTGASIDRTDSLAARRR